MNKGKAIRTTRRRPWIKLYPIDCLEGSIRYQLKPAERGVWYDLLNLSAICAKAGVISDKDGRPYPHSFIAHRLNVPVELLKRTLTKCIEEGRIEENSSGIHIVHWAAYQSEYDRQKPYREMKKPGFDLEGRIASIAGKPPKFIVETVRPVRNKVLALLDKENPSKAAKVRELMESQGVR